MTSGSPNLASVFVGLLTTASAVGPYLGHVDLSERRRQAFPLFVDQNALNLIVALPILLGSEWLAVNLVL